MFPANITRDEARARSALLATDRYVVRVDLSGRDPSGAPLASPDTTFVATSTVTFTAAEADRTHIDVHADEVLAATLDDAELDRAAFADARLPFDVTPGTHKLTVTALFRYSRAGLGLHRFVDPADQRVYLYTQFEVAEARRMYACFEQPDLKATFEISVVAPQDWTVVSNSPAVPPTPAGSTPNTDPQYTMSSSELESEIAQKTGYPLSQVSCSNDLVYVEGRSATCEGPARSGSGTSNIYVTVEWAVIDDGRVRAYFTFNQYS